MAALLHDFLPRTRPGTLQCSVIALGHALGDDHTGWDGDVVWLHSLAHPNGHLQHGPELVSDTLEAVASLAGRRLDEFPLGTPYDPRRAHATRVRSGRNFTLVVRTEPGKRRLIALAWC